MREVTIPGRGSEGTRGQVLELLLSRGRMTVAELSSAMGITAGGLRRHLDRLRAEGLVDVESLRQEMGRPVHIYRATEAAEGRNARYARFTERLVEEVTVLQPDEVRGMDGPALLDTVFQGIARRVVDEHRSRVSHDDLGRRITEVTQELREEGILSGWERTPEGYRLFNATCPYRKVAHSAASACSMDREVVEELLGVPVQQVGRLVDGEVRCEYVVAVEAETKRDRRSKAAAQAR